MPISALAGLVFGTAILSIGLYHSIVVGPHFRSIARTLQGGAEDLDGDSIALLRASLGQISKRWGDRLDRLEVLAAKEMLRIGFLRYNSFSDVGSDQSFTLALLNSDGDGVVLTSIFGREETRTYGKSVRAFVPQQGVSKEEQTAISMARERNGALAPT